MTAVIIEDEKALRIAFKEMLKLYCPQVEVIGEADRIKTAASLIIDQNPDVIFLDIRLPDGNAFDLLNQLSNDKENDNLLGRTAIIFTTAHEEYAVKAFKLSATDYLLKPVDPDELIESVSKVQKKMDESTQRGRLNTLLDNMQQTKEFNKKIALHTASGFLIYKISEIRRCEAEINYTRFYFRNNTSTLTSKTLKEYEQLLVPYGFMRTHKSHLVNLDCVRKYDQRGYLVLDTDEQIPLAYRKKEQLYQIIHLL